MPLPFGLLQRLEGSARESFVDLHSLVDDSDQEHFNKINENDVLALVAVLKARSHITTGIDLFGTFLTHSPLSAIASLDTIEILNLGNSRIMPDHVPLLAGMKQLKQLDLSYNSQLAGSNALISFAKHPTLRDLTLTDCGLEDSDLEFLRDNVCLQRLVIQNNAIGDAGAALLGTLQVLTELDIGCNVLTSDGAISLAKLPLTSLCIGSNRVGDKGLAVLGSNPCLIELSAPESQVGDCGVQELMRGNSTIRRLLLGFNSVSSIGASAIAAQDSLTNVNLYSNRLNNDAIVIFGQMLMRSTSSLIELNLGANLGIKEQAELQELMNAIKKKKQMGSTAKRRESTAFIQRGLSGAAASDCIVVAEEQEGKGFELTVALIEKKDNTVASTTSGDKETAAFNINLLNKKCLNP